jgi:hypothetical protein
MTHEENDKQYVDIIDYNVPSLIQLNNLFDNQQNIDKIDRTEEFNKELNKHNEKLFKEFLDINPYIFYYTPEFIEEFGEINSYTFYTEEFIEELNKFSKKEYLEEISTFTKIRRYISSIISHAKTWVYQSKK